MTSSTHAAWNAGVSPLHPAVRRFDLQDGALIDVGFHGVAMALLAARVLSGPPLGENPGGGYREIEIRAEFASSEAPLAGVTFIHRLAVHVTNWFLWPQEGERLPVLLHLKKTLLEGKKAARIVCIERAESLVRRP